VNLMSDATSVNSVWDRRRWLTLGVIGIAQLMIVLDVTVMNIALPSAQHALHFTTVDRQWVVTAYTLTFGSLLLRLDPNPVPAASAHARLSAPDPPTAVAAARASTAWVWATAAQALAVAWPSPWPSSLCASAARSPARR